MPVKVNPFPAVEAKSKVNAVVMKSALELVIV